MEGQYYFSGQQQMSTARAFISIQQIYQSVYYE